MSDAAPTARWAALVGDSAVARAAGAELIGRWAEPHRRYHATPHLVAVLDAVDLLLGDGVTAPDVDAVRLAAWFHDAVYDGRSGEDEGASAALAQRVLGELGVDPARVGETARLVLLTTTHDPAPDDAAGALLCDADLSVLGGTEGAYAAYAAAVREEYADVPSDAFRDGRAAVLQRLLRRDPIFRTAAARGRWEAAARRNLAAEIAALGNAPGKAG